MVEYTVAVCNYNMADTLERSLRSILDQVDDRFEVVVVDGGSTDGSVDVLEALAAEYDTLRYDVTGDEYENLGGDRNRSFELARGEYVLESFDCDNRYYDIVQDLVEVYHQLEAGIDRPFLLSAMGVNMAPRDLVLRVPYYDLGGAEDRDWFRRLAARDAIVWLERTGPIKDQAGYEKGLRWQVRRDLDGKVCDFRCGITFPSAVAWAFAPDHPYIYEERRPLPLTALKRAYDLLTYPYTYLRALREGRHEAPREFRRKGALERTIAEERATFRELAERFDVTVDCSKLSPTGRRAFCGGPSSRSRETVRR